MITTALCFICSTAILCMQKQKKVLKKAALVIVIVLLVFTVNNPDYGIYQYVYLYGGGPFAESTGFFYLSAFLKGLGIHDYRGFLFLTALLIVFVFRQWEKVTRDIFYVIYFYTLFCMYYDVIQIRNTIAAFLTLYALLLTVNHKNPVYTGIPLLLACTFHKLAVLTGLITMYLAVIKPRKDFSVSKKELLVLSAAGVGNALAGRKAVSWLGGQIGSLGKILIYITPSADWSSFIIWTGSSAFLLFMLWNYGVRQILSRTNTAVSIEKKRAVNLLYRFSLFSLIVSGMTLYLNEMGRIYRLFFLAEFLIYAVIRRDIQDRNRRILFAAICFVNMTFMAVWMMRGIDFDSYW